MLLQSADTTSGTAGNQAWGTDLSADGVEVDDATRIVIENKMVLHNAINDTL